MNKFALSLSAVLLLGVCFTGCKEDLTEEELLNEQLAQLDSLQKRGGIIKYTVKLASTASTSMLKSSEQMSLKGGVVTVYQNDSSYTVTTDSLGIAFFSDLRIGTALVNVKLPGHAEVDYVTDLTPADKQNGSENVTGTTVRYASSIVPMFPTENPGCATITGTVTGELDLTNSKPEVIKGARVTATVDVADSSFVKQYLGDATTSAGKILKYALANASFSTVSDSLGKYALKVPASVNGLPIKISVEDYEGEQKLYLENDPTTGEFKPGTYTVPVLFSSDVEASEIPTVKPIYAIVDEPNAPVGIAKKTAKLEVQLDEKGSIIDVTVIEKGLYTSKPMIFLWSAAGSNGLLDPVFNSETGEVEDVKIINSGSGYTAPTYAVVAISNKLKRAIIDVSPDDYGTVTSATMVDGGSGYFQKEEVQFLSPNTNCVVPIALCQHNWYGNLTTIFFSKCGSGYGSITNTPKKQQSIKHTALIKALPNKNFTNSIYLGTGLKK